MICDTCIHKEVCYEIEEDREALKFCGDYFNFIVELEKIKTEIKEKQSKYTDRWVTGVTDYSYGCYRGYYETIKLIDKHISKLKGE